MNALAVITKTDDPAFSTWVDEGRDLARRRRDVDWELADWMMAGKDRGYLDQTGFDFIADNLGIAPRRLKDISRAAEAFPAHMRDPALSIEHHASAAALPKQEAMELLHVARERKWSPERVRSEASHRIEQEPSQSARDSDAMLESFIRHWNRLPRSVRIEAAELIANSHGDEIEP